MRLYSRLPAFAAILFLLHLPILTLPFHWDELGQFVPAALDLYRDGSLVTHTALPNVHPPGVMAILAAVWSVVGYSIASARLAMLAIASLGVFWSYLLARRLGAPALATVILLTAAPLFFTQSMMVLLDMPAMALTMLTLLLFLDGRYAACAVAATALVLVKETALSTPLVLAGWLWLREKKRKEALYFVAPVIALGLWLVKLHSVTGHWLGNAEFASFNVADSLSINHILYATMRRVWALFIADGHWLGTLALIYGLRVLRGPKWTLVLWIALAQIAVVTIFGGAVLDRYLVPILPILYAAFAAALSLYSQRKRLAWTGAMVAFFVLGWYWNPPFPFPYENNLGMVDFVRLQQQAARFLETKAPNARIASAWPFTDAILHPEFGYVSQPLHPVRIESFFPQDIEKLNGNDFDVLVVYLRDWSESSFLRIGWIRGLVQRFNGLQDQATAEQIKARLGFVPIAEWARGGQWIRIYVPFTVAASLPEPREPWPTKQPR